MPAWSSTVMQVPQNMPQKRSLKNFPFQDFLFSHSMISGKDANFTFLIAPPLQYKKMLSSHRNLRPKVGGVSILARLGGSRKNGLTPGRPRPYAGRTWASWFVWPTLGRARIGAPLTLLPEIECGIGKRFPMSERELGPPPMLRTDAREDK